MSFEDNPADDEARDPHGECRHEIERLRQLAGSFLDDWYCVEMELIQYRGIADVDGAIRNCDDYAKAQRLLITESP